MGSSASSSAPPAHSSYAHSIESIIFRDMSLMEKHDGVFQIMLNRPPDHADSILMGAADNARKEASNAPSQAQLLSKPDIINKYKKMFDACSDKNYTYIRQTIIAPVPQFTRAPLKSLSSITFSDMLLDHIHKGRYVLCRVIHEPVHMVAIQVAIEDQNGDVAELALYHCFETKGMNRGDIASLLPVGTVILVREPWFKRGATGGYPTIRVDLPTDISFPTHSELLQPNIPPSWRPSELLTANDYEQIGDEALEKNHLEAAMRAYTSGLSIDASAYLMRLNRAWCHLKLGNIAQALEDASTVSKDDKLTPEHRAKARHRLALVYYAMDRFSNALEALNNKNVPRSWIQDYKALRTKSETRLKEQTTGKYDWFGLFKTSVQNPDEMLDVADYVGPVDFVEMPGKPSGRGVVATRAVAAGELLFVTKPFAFASASEFPNELLRGWVPQDSGVNDKPYYELTGRAVRRLVGSRTAASALFLSLSTLKDNILVPPSPPQSIDIAKKGARPWTDPTEYDIGDININKIGAIFKEHMFQEPVRGLPDGFARGVYLAPELVNHSCNGNALGYSIGFVQYMRASRNLAKGEEVTCHSAGSNDVASFLGRESQLSKWLERCECSLCEADRKDGLERCARREIYYQEVLGLQMGLAPVNIIQLQAHARGLVELLRETYLATRTEPMHALGVAQRILGFAYYATDPNKTYNSYSAALKSYGVRWKTNSSKYAPANRSQMSKNSLIIHTDNFPSQLNDVLDCIKMMSVLAALKHQPGQESRLARHWAVAALWTHEAFFGPGKQFLWANLGVEGHEADSPLVALLKGF